MRTQFSVRLIGRTPYISMGGADILGIFRFSPQDAKTARRGDPGLLLGRVHSFGVAQDDKILIASPL